MLSLVLGTGWFVAALAAASGLVLVRGTRPDAWGSAVLLPAAVGCVLLLVGVVAELEALVGIGFLLVAGSLAGSMVLLARSLLAGPASAVAHRQQAGIGR